MLSVCRKSLAEFAAHRQQRIEIIFSHDMCVRENTSQASSVEFLRLWHTNYARSRLQAFCRKNPEDFSDSLREPAAKAAGSLRLSESLRQKPQALCVSKISCTPEHFSELQKASKKWVPKKPP